MLNKAAEIEDAPVEKHHNHHQSQQQSVVIGDILLHSENKLVVLQVIIHPPISPTLVIEGKPMIHHSSPKSLNNGNGSKAIVPCDLKNSSNTKSNEKKRKISNKQLVRIQRVGLMLVNDFKSKFRSSDQSDPQVLSVRKNETS